jgi:hypothetical protein
VNRTSIPKVATLLHVSEVVEDQDFEAIETAQGALEVQIAFRAEQLSDHLIGGTEEHFPATLDQLMADRGGKMGLASAGQTEEQ